MTAYKLLVVHIYHIRHTCLAAEGMIIYKMAVCILSYLSSFVTADVKNMTFLYYPFDVVEYVENVVL